MNTKAVQPAELQLLRFVVRCLKIKDGLERWDLLAMSDRTLQFNPSGYSLEDFPAFAPFERIADDLGVTLTVFGGAASRAMMRKLAGNPDEEMSLFDLAPFSSDFDLSHDGDEKITDKLRERISEDIMFSSWFRWSILDAEKSRAARAARSESTNVPLRRIEIGNRGSTRVSPQAIDDINTKSISYQRNKNYQESYLAQKGRDVEFFGILLALNALLDMREIFGQGKLITNGGGNEGWLSRKNVARQLDIFSENPHLTTRFWNLMANLFTRAGRELLSEFPLLASIEEAARELPQTSILFEQALANGRGLASSRATATGEYRVPDIAPDVLTGRKAQEFAERFLLSLPASRDIQGDTTVVRLDPNFELIAAIQEVELKPLKPVGKKRDDYDPFLSAANEEFLEVAWSPPPGQRLNASGITACMIPYPATFSAPYTFDVPAVGGVFGNSRPWVRIRLDDLIEHSSDGRALKAAILIMQVPSGDSS